VPGLSIVPSIDVAPSAVSFQPVAFLNFTLELIETTVDLIKVVIRELTPLLLDLAFELFPISFDSVPIHDFVLAISFADEGITPVPCLCSEKSPVASVENDRPAWFMEIGGDVPQASWIGSRDV
jgi:hypothetical protein